MERPTFLNRKAELLRLIQWAKRKRLIGPLKLYLTRYRQEEAMQMRMRHAIRDADVCPIHALGKQRRQPDTKLLSKGLSKALSTIQSKTASTN